MSKQERETFEPQDPTAELFWEIDLKQLNSLVEGLFNYKNFQRLREDPGGAPLPFDFVAYYQETCEQIEYYLFVEKTEEKGKFYLTVSRGASPVIRDILGSNLPPVRFSS
ncbi:hypothetical protein MUP46_00600 [Patescibacteria group bacterium]|nr:hypothetical protein [Patescibacteria group bacterium]